MEQSIMDFLQQYCGKDAGKLIPIIIPLIASGGITVLIISNIKRFFSFIYESFIAFSSFSITNTSEYDCKNNYEIVFDDFISSKKTIWERNIEFDLKNRIRYTDDGIIKTLNRTNTTPSIGFSIKWIYNRPVLIYRDMKKDGQRLTYTTTLKVFFIRKAKFMKKFMDDFNSQYNNYMIQLEDGDCVRIITQTNWFGIKHKRSVDSIFTNNDCHKDLINDVKKFINNKEIYLKLNYPYKYTCLLHGVPGSGKTSTILALASELKRNIVYVNITSMSIDKLCDTINQNTNSNIYVFEDIDAISQKVNVSRKTEKDEDGDPCSFLDMNSSSISLSDILNLTDGLLSSDGAICIFTTNHIEKLDEAFLRAGRMNKIVKYDYLNSSTSNRMIKANLGYEVNGLKNEIKPAELQEEILNILVGKSTKENLIEKFCEKVKK